MSAPLNWQRLLGVLACSLLGLLSHQLAASEAPIQLRTGDVLFIALPGEDTLNKDFRIDKQGQIWLPEVGDLRLQNLSLEAAKQRTREALSRYFQDLAGFDLSLRERRLLIQVLGRVHKPGEYELPDGSSIQTALSAAGNLRSGAQLDSLHIRRKGQVIPFDFKAYLDTGDPEKLPQLQTLDTLFVPVSPLTGNVEAEFDAASLLAKGDSGDRNDGINVFGQVLDPGRFSWSEKDNLIHYLMRAGGVNQYADVSRIRILAENASPALFDLTAFLDSGQDTLLPTITPGATIYVPIASAQPEAPTSKEQVVSLFGAVNRPGRFTHDDELSILDYLLLAGGVNQAAAVHEIRILDNAKPAIFNLAEYLDSGAADLMPPIRAGATIYVPVQSVSDPTSARMVYVMGEVFKPGAYELPRSGGFFDAFAHSGGPSRFADIRQIRILRQDASILPFDLDAYIEGKVSSPLPRLQAGDTIFVPEKAQSQGESWVQIPSNRAVSIVGAVHQPGRYEWDPDMSLLDLIGQAGGPRVGADIATIRIIPGGEDAGAEPITLNYADYIARGETLELPRIKSGYTIMVPALQDTGPTINVIGAVNRPGRIDFKQDMNLIDALALAGGHGREADVAHIRIVPAGSANQSRCEEGCRKFDLNQFELYGETVLPSIGAGDTVIVPQLADTVDNAKSNWLQQDAQASIYVMGAVGKPGRYAFNDALHFLDILSAADGPAENADLHRVRVSHRSGKRARVSEVNLALYFDTGDEHLLPQVRPQDVIYVPHRGRQWLDVSKESTVRLLGAIKVPGRYEFNSEMTVLDLLAEAGGPTSAANVHDILIVTRSVDGPVSRRFDLKAFAGHGDFGALPVVRSGDTIYVPEREDSGWVQFMRGVRDVVSVLSLVAIIVAL